MTIIKKKRVYKKRTPSKLNKAEELIKQLKDDKNELMVELNRVTHNEEACNRRVMKILDENKKLFRDIEQFQHSLYIANGRIDIMFSIIERLLNESK